MNTKFSFFAFVLLAAGSVLAQDYEIKMHRPHKVGDKYNASFTHKQTSEMSISSGGAVVKSEKKEFMVEADSVVTVLAVNTNGSNARESHLVNKLVRIENGQRTEILPKGTLLTVSRKGNKPLWEKDGQPVDKLLEESLLGVGEASRGTVSNDEVFGTQGRKRVGDSWPLNFPLIVREAAAEHPGFVKSVNGQTTLKAVGQEPGEKAATLDVEMTAQITPPLPNGLTSRESTMVTTLSGKFPLDVTKNLMDETLQMTVAVHATGQPDPNGPEMDLKLIQKRSMTRKKTLVK